MKKVNIIEFKNIMTNRAEAIHNGEDLEHLTGVIVFSQDNWKEEYSLESRSYRVSSSEKYFGSWYGGYSLFGYSLDGTDYARLERCNWKVDYCYIEE